MSTFFGIGLGPIQTGIFVAGAARGGFDRIVIAEVNAAVRDAVNAAGAITVNVAGADQVRQESYGGVEVYDPGDPAGLAALTAAAAEATELATALPSVDFFRFCAPYLRGGFARAPERRRFIYCAENHNHAAELLSRAVGGDFPATFYLNTVVGKMSGVFAAAERDYPPLAPGAPGGHLVEEFDRIYISNCPGIAERRVASLHVCSDLYPYEEAKLYGHNAVHFLLGMLGKSRGCEFMSELSRHPDLIALARRAFSDESGAALLKKYRHIDAELFTAAGFAAYADDLLIRMKNPFLADPVARITRDPERKLGWDDRVVGTMRLALSQGITPAIFAGGGRLALSGLSGAPREALGKLWPAPWGREHEILFRLLTGEE